MFDIDDDDVGLSAAVVTKKLSISLFKIRSAEERISTPPMPQENRGFVLDVISEEGVESKNPDVVVFSPSVKHPWEEGNCSSTLFSLSPLESKHGYEWNHV
jgi:hypothetical protein